MMVIASRTLSCSCVDWVWEVAARRVSCTTASTPPIRNSAITSETINSTSEKPCERARPCE